MIDPKAHHEDREADEELRDPALRAEATRLYRRYAVEVVERFNLCPWALRARRDESVQESIFARETYPATRPVLRRIQHLEQAPKTEVALLVFAALEVACGEFEQWVAELQSAYAAEHEHGATPFAMAAFHPHAAADLEDSERLIAFLRRSPDPTIQLIRSSSLERVRAHRPAGTQFVDIALMSPRALAEPERPSLRRQIADQNLGTVKHVGIATLEAILQDIARDRSESYRRLGWTLH